MGESLRVCWLAAPLARSQEQQLAAEQVELVPEGADCDVVVVDPTTWPTRPRAAASGGPAPTMLLVSEDTDRPLVAQLARLPESMVVESRSTHPALLARRLRQLGSAPDLEIDPLTGLSNRRGLQRWLRRNEGRDVVAVELDVDQMKQVNDLWGHDVGDGVLTEIGTRLEQHIPLGGLICRISGDEFVVVVLRGETEPRLLAEYLRRGAEIVPSAPASGDPSGGLAVQLSAGVSSGRVDLDGLVQQAHIALVAAKARGRDRTMEYEAMRENAWGSFEEQAFEDMTLVAAQRAAETIASGGRRMFSLLRDEADTDALTSLPNRRYFNKKLAWEMRLATERQTPLSLIWVDIDHFGQFNKRFSYAVGDSVLRHVAQTVNRYASESGWVARWGGEEFAVVLGGLRQDRAVELAERMRAAVEVEDFVPEDRRKLHVTISAGVAEWVVGEGVPELVERISKAVAAAKEHRNSVWPQPGVGSRPEPELSV
jgi:diguanylate cyclase (GGDEF)-like protein